MASIDVQNAVDTMLLEQAPTNKYPSYDGLWCGLAAGNRCRDLIKFDWTGIPDTDQIDSITVTLNQQAIDAYNGTNTVSLHRVLVPWNISEACWNERQTGTGWSVAGLQSGVDYEASALASATIAEGDHTTPIVLNNFTVGAGVTKLTLDSGYGWVLIGSETQQGGQDTLRNIDSTENATPSNRPRLQVSSSAPGSGGKPYYAYAQQ